MRVSPTLIALLAASGMVGLYGSRADGSPLPDDQSSASAAGALALVSDLDQAMPPIRVTGAVPSIADLAQPPVADAVESQSDSPQMTGPVIFSDDPTAANVSVADLTATPAAPADPTNLAAEAIAQLRQQIAHYQTSNSTDLQDWTAQQDSQQFEFPAGDSPTTDSAPAEEDASPTDGSMEASPADSGNPDPNPVDSTTPDSATPGSDNPDAQQLPADAPDGADQSPSDQSQPADDGTSIPETSPDSAAPTDTPPDTDNPEVTPNPNDGDNQPAPDQPQPQSEEPAEPRVLVAEVAVTGPKGDINNFLTSEVYRAIRTRPGRTTTRTQIQQDINAIYATGYFANVGAKPEDTPLGVRVTFVVQPNPVLSFVRIVGDSGAAVQTSESAADLGPSDQTASGEDNPPADDTETPAPDTEGTDADNTGTTTETPGESSDTSNVEVVDSRILPQSVVADIFGDQVGKIINLIDFQNGILKLNEWYQQQGYVLAQVVAAPRVSDDGVVTLDIAEGVIEDIQVRFITPDGDRVDEDGNPIQGRTHDYIITREFTTQPGDVFNQNQIERDFQQAFSLGIFEDVQLSLEPGSDNPRKVDVIVNATESNTGSVAAGLGFNFTGDLFGTLSYRQDNFGGNNQKLSAEAQISTRDLLFDVSFTDPWIAGDPFHTSYTANAFARRSINLNFDGGPTPIDLANGDRVRIRRLGTGITFSRPLDNHWTVSLGTLVQNVSARDADGKVNAFDAAGNPLTISNTGVDDLWTFPLTAELDLRNDPYNPTSGSIMRLSTEQSVPLGRGSILMNRLRGSYSYYIPVSFINFSDGPQSIALNAQLGTILGEVPPYEAFALGGTNSIRGYDEGAVGSGRSYAQFTAEYRFPLFSFLGGALFLDAGSDLGSGNAVPGAPGPSRGKPGSGYGYGAGLRIQTPLGPLRIDYGFNDQGQGRLHFGIGERF